MAAQVAEAVAAEHQLDLLRVKLYRMGQHSRLVVTLDRPDGDLTLDQLSAFSEDLGRRLDEAYPIHGSYSLECESPGPQRPLQLPRDIDRFRGATVSARLQGQGKGHRKVKGRLVDATEGTVRLLSLSGAADEAEIELALSEIDEVYLDDAPAPSEARARRKGRGK